MLSSNIETPMAASFYKHRRGYAAQGRIGPVGAVEHLRVAARARDRPVLGVDNGGLSVLTMGNRRLRGWRLLREKRKVEAHGEGKRKFFSTMHWKGNV